MLNNDMKTMNKVKLEINMMNTFDDDRCGVGSVWLLKTGLAGVRGQVGDPISKSSCIVGVPPPVAKWLWL